MTTNLDRFKKDLEALLVQGEKLYRAMRYESDKDEYVKQAKEQLSKEEVKKLLEDLPSFKIVYESWYSESLALINQVLPLRAQDFISHYEKPKNRKDITWENYVIQDYMQGIRSRFSDGVTTAAAFPRYTQQLAILAAAQKRFVSSLFEIRQIVQADLFDSEIDAARELHKNKFMRAAGAVAGVVLEKHLLQVCSDHSIKITKKNPTISDLNELLKGNNVIGIPEWRHISLLADIRNLCDHNKNQEPTPEQVKDLIDGTDKVLRTIV